MTATQIATVTKSEEAAAIAACEHGRAESVDHDYIWSRDGMSVIGETELTWCPDCPLLDWIPTNR